MSDFDYAVILDSWPLLLLGIRYTLQLTVIATIGGIALGTLLAVARLSHNRTLSMLAAGYVNTMRSLPLLLVIFWFYFMMPLVLQSITGSEWPVAIGADRSAYITFILFEAAYFCEIMRAGIQSVPKGQFDAGHAIGLTSSQTMRLIVLPQAWRNMLPLLLTQTIILFQDVSLVSLLNVTDFVGAAVKIAQRDSRVVEMYLFVAVVYFLLSLALSAAVKRIHKRYAIVR
ncbi:amino acid ABC transporter permease [Oxalicibacterium solurbis]|uniref:Glutamate/aspartate import permease protein GltK n=1 Tax=Oxalicibacterium solurbis TaxID=69280 RepID=A0A8J3F6Z7_9BURK|nr:amino acid ABC transporter permease [Oxalicibacterium solurbis]GGI55378.1 glutamate/aspartate transporter permease GltK [Oxalicibacterium solurbis]